MTNPNQSAFPYVRYDEDNKPFVDTAMRGLTKRELYSAMAMMGFCASQGSWEDHNATDRAEASVKQADALIAALNKGEGK